MGHDRLIQYAVFGATALLAVVLTVAQTRLDRSVFARYLGSANPVVVMLVVAIVGFASLTYLHSKGWFDILGEGSLVEGVRFVAASVPLFAAAAIGADMLLRYPEGMNVPLPDAVFFYPAIGFLVEVCFHALPLALLVALFAQSGMSDRTFWMLAIVVALIEAGFQAATATTPATAVFSGLQLFAFGLVQLHVFRRYGFVPMYVFRLAYYSLWHVAWGALRLRWLF